MLLNAIMELQRQIREFKFGVHREEAARAAEAAAMAAVPRAEMKGLLA
jgi:NADH-quinone oxidoreductase subunit B